jgi:hypothetical protein
MEVTLPKKMTSKDKIPRKPTDNIQGKSNHKVTRKDRKPPPEAAARKRNMDSDLGSEYESGDDPG